MGMAVCIFFALGKGLGLHAHDIAPENEVPLNKAIYTFVILYVGYRCLGCPSCHSHRAYKLTKYVGLNVYGCQKLYSDILSLLDSWSESLSFRELRNDFRGCCGGYSLDTGTNISLPSTVRRV